MAIFAGWVSIHRKLIESPIYSDSQAVHLWLHLLLLASHADGEFVHNGQLKTIKRGQILTGRLSISSQTGINESKVERLLTLFEKLGMIEQQKNSKNRLISITKYDLYQQSEQQLNNKRTTNEQQMNTYNNDNNDNNIHTASEDGRVYVPIQNIVELYNRICTNMAACKVVNTSRKNAIKARWKESDKHQSIEFWESFFEKASMIPWMNGNGNGMNWVADFDYLIRPTGFAKVIEAKI